MTQSSYANKYSTVVVEVFGPVNSSDAQTEPLGPAALPQTRRHICEHATWLPHWLHTQLSSAHSVHAL